MQLHEMPEVYTRDQILERIKKAELLHENATQPLDKKNSSGGLEKNPILSRERTAAPNTAATDLIMTAIHRMLVGAFAEHVPDVHGLRGFEVVLHNERRVIQIRLSDAVVQSESTYHVNDGRRNHTAFIRTRDIHVVNRPSSRDPSDIRSIRGTIGFLNYGDSNRLTPWTYLFDTPGNKEGYNNFPIPLYLRSNDMLVTIQGAAQWVRKMGVPTPLPQLREDELFRFVAHILDPHIKYGGKLKFKNASFS